VSSGDPNLGNPGPGITVKTDVGFYQLDHSKNDFRLLREFIPLCVIRQIKAWQVHFLLARVMPFAGLLEGAMWY
jgi:hypothetical protein